MKSKSEAARVHNKSKEVVSAEEARPGLSGEPSHEVIQRRAYEIYLQRGGTDGQDLEDWLQAKRELKSK